MSENTSQNQKDKIIDSFSNDIFQRRRKNPFLLEDNEKAEIVKKGSDLPLETIEKPNEDFIQRHLNDSVFNNLCGCSLNNEQKRAILCDSKYNLVVAGEKSGKTLTVCGKIKYLLENKLATEEDILVLSYLNVSVDELNEKMAEMNPNLNLEAKTFHSLGFDILSDNFGAKKAVDDQLLAHIKAFFDERYNVDKYLRDNVYHLIRDFYPVYVSYVKSVDTLIEKFKSKNFNVLSEALKSSQGSSKRLLTIKKESVRSEQELIIANYLFVNGIKYEYEKPYKINTATPDKRQYCPDFFLPDYGIYIEHYSVYRLAKEKEYKESWNWKEEIHKQNNTTCIKTYSRMFKDETIFKRLKKDLGKYGVKFKPWTQNRIKEVKNAILNLYGGGNLPELNLSSVMNVLETFLSFYKSKYKDDEGFNLLLHKFSDNERKRIKIKRLVEISKEIYHFYLEALKKDNKIDFDDMILQSTDFLRRNFSNKYRYKYILIDEFSDIPPSIFNFLKALVEHGNSKLMAVGDNRQYQDRFRDQDISEIWGLKETTFPNAVINKINVL